MRYKAHLRVTLTLEANNEKEVEFILKNMSYSFEDMRTDSDLEIQTEITNWQIEDVEE